MRQDLTSSETKPVSTAKDTSYVGKTSSENSSLKKAKTQLESPFVNSALASHFQFSQLKKEECADKTSKSFQSQLKEVELHLDVILGRTRMSIESLLKLRVGAVVALDKLAGEPVEIEANGKLIAKGEVVVLDDTFGVKIIQMIE